MKDKNIPNDYNSLSLEELTKEANKMIEDLESQKNLEIFELFFKSKTNVIGPGQNFLYNLIKSLLKIQSFSRFLRL